MAAPYLTRAIFNSFDHLPLFCRTYLGIAVDSTCHVGWTQPVYVPTFWGISLFFCMWESPSYFTPCFSTGCCSWINCWTGHGILGGHWEHGYQLPVCVSWSCFSNWWESDYYGHDSIVELNNSSRKVKQERCSVVQHLLGWSNRLGTCCKIQLSYSIPVK